MATFFFDSSAIVKRYVTETGSLWVNSLVRTGTRNVVQLSSIAGVEVVSALTRRGRGSGPFAALVTSAIRQFQSDLANRYRTVPVTGKLLVSAMVLAEKYALRGYDAVHLAAALRVNTRRLARNLRPLTLVSADTDLNTAAVAEGLPVEDPNNHP